MEWLNDEFQHAQLVKGFKKKKKMCVNGAAGGHYCVYTVVI